MKSLVVRFAKNESGATAIEYGLIAAVIGCVIIVGATVLGNDLSDLFSRIGARLASTNV